MPRFIPDDVLEQIRLRADIVEIVQSYVPTLRRAGTAWKACCPFHQEKTPSFSVNPTRQSYKCFGCGKGGNVFTFVMEMEKLDFPNAAEFLARKYGVVIPEQDAGNRNARRGYAFKNKSDATSSASAPEADYNVRERLYTLHEKLAAWYAENLEKRAVPAVADYFATRGIAPEFTRQFMIGASPDTWDSAVNFAHRLGFTDEELRLSGIVSTKEENSDHIYDRFRNRLMFPIWNEQGRIVAFSARSIEKDPQGWKYVNSPESPVFKKSKTLYALHFARNTIADRKFAILCEGQLDVIALHRAGCTNAVAAQGTAFGIDHARILKRYTGEIRLALDNDKAGRKAVFADAEILLPLGFNLRVVTWQNAKDADEVLKGQGAAGITSAVDSSCDFFDFALQEIMQQQDASSPAGKAQIAAFMLEKILLLESSAMQEAYLQWLAKKLSLAVESLRMDFTKKLNDAKRRDQYRERRDAERENLAAEKATEDPVPAAGQERRLFSDRYPILKENYLKLLQLVLTDESLAQEAAHDIDERLCDESPVGIALDRAIQYTLDGDWQNAAGKIMMELAQAGSDIGELAGILNSEDAGEENEDAGQHSASENLPHPLRPDCILPADWCRDFMAGSNKEQQRPALTYHQQVYHDCVRQIKLLQCYFRMEELAAEAAALRDDDPEKMQILSEVYDCSRLLRSISNSSK